MRATKPQNVVFISPPQRAPQQQRDSSGFHWEFVHTWDPWWTFHVCFHAARWDVSWLNKLNWLIDDVCDVKGESWEWNWWLKTKSICKTFPHGVQIIETHLLQWKLLSKRVADKIRVTRSLDLKYMEWDYHSATGINLEPLIKWSGKSIRRLRYDILLITDFRNSYPQYDWIANPHTPLTLKADSYERDTGIGQFLLHHSLWIQFLLVADIHRQGKVWTGVPRAA